VNARIRPVEPVDHEAVRQLVGDVLAEFGFSRDMASVERDLGAAAARYAQKGSGFWVAELDGAVVGTVAVRPKSEGVCEIKRLYLRPDRRGSGLGQALYAHAEEFARSAGYRRIWLDSSRRFARAHRLYVRNGFTLVASLDNEWEDDVFEKELT
jgi:GNAT superfamily N-acetyltransferase